MTSPGVEAGWGELAGIMTQGLCWKLGQPWLPGLEAGFAPGRIRVARVEGKLLIFATLRDDDPRNKATRDNDITWTKGDVVEVFLKDDGAPDYYEFHVTPENRRLQVHLPSESIHRTVQTLKSWMVDEPLFESRTRISSSRRYWRAFFRIDLARLFGKIPERLRLLIGRYDAHPAGKPPTVSCSGKLSERNFHRPREWSLLDITSVPSVITQSS